MRNASVALLHRLARRLYTLSSSSSIASYSNTCVQFIPRTNSHDVHMLRRFHAIPSQDAGAQTSPQVSTRKKKTLEKNSLEEAFEAAETTTEMLRLFGEMESRFEEKHLGLASLKLGLKLDQEGEAEKALQFGVRAFKALGNDEVKNTLPAAMALQLAGSACYNLNKFRDALGYLSKAKRVLAALEQEKDACMDDIRPIMHAVLLVLGNAKTALGRNEEALEDLKKCLEIKEIILGKESKDFGVAVREMAEAYVDALNFKEALKYGLRALEIHTKELGNNSVEVAHDRRVLGLIYGGLGDNNRALIENEMSQKVLKSWGHHAELRQAEIDASNIRIALGNYEEAVNNLKGLVQRTEKDSITRAVVFISMAKALSLMKKNEEAKKCLEIACGILDKKEKASADEMADAYSEAASQYEAIGEYEPAISLLKKSLNWLEKSPVEQVSEARISAKIGWLLLLTGKVSDAIPYMEDAADRLKESFGPNHYGVGCIYNNLGAAYMELARPASAAKMYHLSKDIMDVAFGPHHCDTIDACQNLSKAYSAMKNYRAAIEFQQQALSGWESHGPEGINEAKEARRVLDQLMAKIEIKNKTVDSVFEESSKEIDATLEDDDVVEAIKQIEMRQNANRSEADK